MLTTSHFKNLSSSVLSILLLVILSACSDSNNSNQGSSETDTSFRGEWSEHDCAMAIPDGLVQNDFECGTFIVPINWDDPDGERLSFEVAALKSRSTESKSDPLVFMGGGPGAWNLEGYLYREANSVLAPIAQTRDIVFFDKRGNGLSNPNLFCPEYYEQTLLAYSLVQDIAQDADMWLAGYEQCHTRLSGEGVNHSVFNSYQIASDLVSLMEALGYETYNLFGISYGTREAQVVMRDHSEKVRSVILDSTIVPASGLQISWAPNFERAYDLVFEACAASSSCGALYPELEKTFVEVVNRLNDIPHYSPVTQTDGTTLDVYVTGDRLATAIQQVLYQASLISVIPTVIYSVAAGDMSLVDAFVPQVLSTTGTDWGLYAATLCAEEIPFSSPEEADAAREGLNPILTNPIYEVTTGLLFDLCDIWQVTPRPDLETKPVVSDIPVLILAGEYDPATPPADGARAAELMINSQYFLFNGLSHGVLRSDIADDDELSCAASIVIQFLDEPQATVDGTCASELPRPFD